MDFSWLWLLIIVAMGAYVQTVTGFGFGLLVMGVGGALELLSIAELAFVASSLSFFNGLSGLYGNVWRHAQFKAIGVFLITALPMSLVGLYWLEHLGAHALNVLQGLLGCTMILVCAASLWRPEPRSTLSPPWHFGVCGVLAGILSGLFSTAGPPISYLMYRQPVPLIVIRATLLSIFLVLAGFRSVTSIFGGMMNGTMFAITVLGVPLVLFGSVISRRYCLTLIKPDKVRRMAMCLLVLSGISLLWKAVAA